MSAWRDVHLFSSYYIHCLTAFGLLLIRSWFYVFLKEKLKRRVFLFVWLIGLVGVFQQGTKKIFSITQTGYELTCTGNASLSKFVINSIDMRHSSVCLSMHLFFATIIYITLFEKVAMNISVRWCSQSAERVCQPNVVGGVHCCAECHVYPSLQCLRRSHIFDSSWSCWLKIVLNLFSEVIY